MKKLVLLVLAFTFSIGISAVVFADPPTKIDESDYRIEWSDEFGGTELDKNVWTPQIGNGSDYGNWEWGNQEKEFYKEENATVSDGTLKINAKYEANAGTAGTTTYNFSSARLVTQYKKTFDYGYIEAKIQIPSAKGIWPAFWSMGTSGGTWPNCGEIDIMESFNTKTNIQSTIHYPRVSDQADLCNYGFKDIYDKGEWHTYGCYRDGEVVAFYIDRVRVGYYSTADGEYDCYQNYPWQWGRWEGKRSVLNKKQYLLLNVACGGNLAGGMPDSNLNENMVVDYVRHYVYSGETTTAAPPTTTTLAPTTVVPTTLAPTSIAPTLKPTVKPTVKKPAKAKIKKAKNVKKRKIKISIKKIRGVSGYQVRWCDNKKFDGYEQKNTKKPKLTLKGLDKKTTYWIKARAFKKANKTKVYGKWSAKKKVRVKK